MTVSVERVTNATSSTSATSDAAKLAASADWRVRLHLAKNARYLYKAPNPGILEPLAETDGIIFPYTPDIQVQYSASYSNYDLTHSNYRGFFYTGSQVENIVVTAHFTANDVYEANYLLATLHFLRSATKMFYGNDSANRGMPPPVLFLTGLGEFQFNNHPCVLTSMHYNLPNDADYVQAGVINGTPTSATRKVLNAFRTAEESRLEAAAVTCGAEEFPDPDEAVTSPYSEATYVPTKITINFTMLPVQTRQQVSSEFSVESYASGDLLKKGFW